MEVFPAPLLPISNTFFLFDILTLFYTKERKSNIINIARTISPLVIARLFIYTEIVNLIRSVYTIS
jgi:hypothetical protein